MTSAERHLFPKKGIWRAVLAFAAVYLLAYALTALFVLPPEFMWAVLFVAIVAGFFGYRGRI